MNTVFKPEGSVFMRLFSLTIAENGKRLGQAAQQQLGKSDDSEHVQPRLVATGSGIGIAEVYSKASM
jgi:hypothetical protein